MRIAQSLACAVLVCLGAAFTLLAAIMTGGDSYLADKSSWIYTPWLVALALTSAAIATTATRHTKAATVVIVAAMVAYAVTWIIWGPSEPG